MKITLPNGVQIESDQVTINPDGSMTLTDNDNKLEEEKAVELKVKIARLTNAQLHTYIAIERAGGTASTSWLSKELQITPDAASQRMKTLMAAGVIERTSQKAVYKIVGE